MTVITPNAMPRKANPLHQQILGSLLETRTASWVHRAIDPKSENPKKPNLIETKMAGSELVYPLARNVSEASVERAARRWLP